MIQLAKIEGVWHIITVMDGVRLCWLSRPDWDELFVAEETKVVEVLEEDTCIECARSAAKQGW